MLTFLEPGDSETLAVADPGAGFQVRDVLHSAGALYLIDAELDPAGTILDVALDGGEFRDLDHELGLAVFEFPTGSFIYPAASQRAAS